MNNKEYLNEEKYQKTSKKIFYIGIGIIALGIVIALSIIILKLNGDNKPNKEELQQQLNQLKTKLETRYDELESNGIKKSSNYRNKEEYEMYLIDKTLDPTFRTCSNESINSDNETIKEYCNIKEQIHDFDFNNSFDNDIVFKILPALMILIPCLGLGAGLIMTAKRREITAFQVQQVMPVAQEGIEKMSPTMGNAAKEITKGVKEGMKSNK